MLSVLRTASPGWRALITRNVRTLQVEYEAREAVKLRGDGLNNCARWKFLTANFLCLFFQ